MHAAAVGEPLRVVLCLFGIIPRAIRATWPSIAARVLQVLHDQHMVVTIAAFSMDVGDQLVDGCRLQTADVELIPYDHLEVVAQSKVESIIDADCTPELTHCEMLKMQNLSLAIRRNALKQMYLESMVGRFLARNGSAFDAAVVIHSDFFALTSINASEVRAAAANRNVSYMSTALPAGGFTNGFYIGHPEPVAIFMRRAELYFKGRLRHIGGHGRGYEAHLRAAFVQHGLREAYSDFLFAKVRASASANVPNYTWPYLCNAVKGVRGGLSPDGILWLKKDLTRLRAKLKDGERCLSSHPPASLSFAEMALTEAPAHRYWGSGRKARPGQSHSCSHLNGELGTTGPREDPTSSVEESRVSKPVSRSTGRVSHMELAPGGEALRRRRSAPVSRHPAEP